MENVEQLREEMGLQSLQELINATTEITTIDIAVEAIQQSSQLYKIRKKLHKSLTTAFLTRCPDLEVIVPDFEIFAKLALHLSLHDNLPPELTETLTQQQLLAVNLGLGETLGPRIEDPSFRAACELQIESAAIDKQLHAIAVEASAKFAPNLCNLVGSDITAMLICYAGGLKKLSQIPGCNIKMLGSKKTELMGYSSRSTKNYQGVLYNAEIVRTTPPEQRDAVFRDLANKVALVSRVDAAEQSRDGGYGDAIREKIAKRLESQMNNTTPKVVRPLPIPGMERKDNRGGRRKRAMKKKFGMGEELKARNKVVFGVGGQFDESGEQFGVTAIEGFRRKVSAVDAPFQKKIDRKIKQAEKLRK